MIDSHLYTEATNVIEKVLNGWFENGDEQYIPDITNELVMELYETGLID